MGEFLDVAGLGFAKYMEVEENVEELECGIDNYLVDLKVILGQAPLQHFALLILVILLQLSCQLLNSC